MVRTTAARTLHLVFGALLGAVISSWVAPVASASGVTGRPEPAAAATVEAREASWRAHRALAESSPYRGMPWRPIGPVVQGGRVVDIEVVPGKPYSFYVAYASGGVWRTDNNGVTFEPLFDHRPTIILGDLAVDPSSPDTVWAGTGENNSSRSSYGGAGVFRSTDGGETWEPRGLVGTDRIGRVLVDPRDGNRVLVAALGPLYTPGGQRGVFRTTDGGDTWERILDGDDTTGFVDLVRHPDDPDVLYAAAWERTRRPWNFVEGGDGSAVWKSTDGGDTWTRVGGGLPRGEHVGRIGLAVATSSPSTVYAMIDNQELLPEEDWDLGDGAVTPKRLRGMSREDFLRQDPEEIEDFLRRYDLDPELDAAALIEKVRDGEVTIQDLLDALADANASLFETDVRGLEVYRSDDGGTTWRKTHDEPVRQVFHTYGYYFGQIRVAPHDADRIYVLGVPLLTSADGGKTFEEINEPNVHGDHQAMWIDPDFPDRLFDGNDGGLNMSFDGGKSWLKLNSIPVGQFYTVQVDGADPYNVYGGLQDNGTMKGSSTTIPGVRGGWSRIGGGDGMYVQVDPRDDATTYLGYQFGNYTRIDASGERNRIVPRNKLKEPALRYNWNTPVILSTHNPDVVYFGANRLFRSMDKGETWTAISPDLTRSPERGDVPFATITTLSESALRFGLLWAGTDDGQVRVSPDGGASWNDAAAALPRDRWVSRVAASRHEEKRAFVALNGYRDDDRTVYLYRSDDLGKTWTSIASNLPAEPVNVIVEDPLNPDVLYVGTDRGAYASWDLGESWMALSGGLPNVPVHDMVVHPRERELVAGTHGRSVWILDVLPLQELTPEVRDKPLEVFPLEDIEFERGWKSRRSPWWHRPELDPTISIPFWTRDGGEVVLSVLDDGGRALYQATEEVGAGAHRFEWDLLLDEELALAAEKERVENAAGDKKDRSGKRRERDKAKDDDDKTGEATLATTPWAEAVRLERPLYVTPGTYTVRVSAGDETAETSLEVEEPEKREPRVPEKPKIRGRK